MILELTHMTGGRYKFGLICFRLQTLDMIVVAGETAAVLALWYGVKPIYPPSPSAVPLSHIEPVYDREEKLLLSSKRQHG